MSLAPYFQFPEGESEDLIFKKMISISLILHVSFFLVLGLKALIFPSENLAVDTAIRVDLVDLPDKILALPEKPLEKTATVKESSKPVLKVEMKQSVPKKQAVNLTKPKEKDQALKRIEEFKKEETRKRALEQVEKEVEEQDKTARQGRLREALIKGNKVNLGVALSGLQATEFNEYKAALFNHVHEHWNLPEWLKNASLKVTVIVYIDFRGTVLKRVIRKSSGDDRFDDYALKTVDEASPFPRPPEKFTDLVRVEGIALGFPE